MQFDQDCHHTTKREKDSLPSLELCVPEPLPKSKRETKFLELIFQTEHQISALKTSLGHKTIF